MNLKDTIRLQRRWTIRKFESDEHYEAFKRGEADPYETVDIEGNVLLNTGITEMLNLLSGNGSPTAFDNTNAELGVGDSTTAESPSQTGLQASTNKSYKGMEAGYPSVSGQTITWRAVFGENDANHGWQEFVVRNGSSANVSLNRKVSDQGVKAAGQTWTLDMSITFS